MEIVIGCEGVFGRCPHGEMTLSAEAQTVSGSCSVANPLECC